MQAWNDERLQLVLSKVLRIGVMASAMVVLLGGFCFLTRRGSQRADYHAFQGVPDSYRSVAGVIGAVGLGDCRAVIQLGLLLLIATPVARVAFSLIAFALEGDRTYVAITSVVLAVLIYSLVGH